jgi:hypothetical protein
MFDKLTVFLKKVLKRTEPALLGQLTRTFQSRSALSPEAHNGLVLQGISGFTNNITQYLDAVKKKFPERFTFPKEKLCTTLTNS